jgi:methionyl-tRNA synthetase
LDTFQLPKNGREGKDWEPTGKIKTPSWFTLWERQYRFHCVIFPAMLKAEGSFILPDNVPANEFLNLEGNKLSTSKNWAVWLHEYLEEFQSAGCFTLCMTSNAPETDNDFTWKDFRRKIMSW